MAKKYATVNNGNSNQTNKEGTMNNNQNGNNNQGEQKDNFGRKIVNGVRKHWKGILGAVLLFGAGMAVKGGIDAMNDDSDVLNTRIDDLTNEVDNCYRLIDSHMMNDIPSDVYDDDDECVDEEVTDEVNEEVTEDEEVEEV